ncbi:MAG TPA: hypothetical protein PK156_33580 [Polyangium sp.]|nr:hypothetical protein [Polyangium sp.]
MQFPGHVGSKQVEALHSYELKVISLGSQSKLFLLLRDICLHIQANAAPKQDKRSMNQVYAPNAACSAAHKPMSAALGAMSEKAAPRAVPC